MMDPEDKRVKDLQSLAWSLQSLTNKPGGRFPEQFKSECYKLASKAISLCSDVAYTEESDFVERSIKFVTLIEAKKIEVAEVEEAEKQKLVGKCYRASPGGNYTVGKITDRPNASLANTDSADSGRALSSTAGGARALTASEVAARLSDDPEALYLCDLGLGDGDVETLCQGLKQAGAGLTSLDVSHNHLADTGVQRLVSALAAGACPKLKELHIGFNTFGELGSQMLTGGLAALRRNLVVHLDGDGAARAERAAPVVAESSASADLERPAHPREVAQELSPLPAPTLEEGVPGPSPAAEVNRADSGYVAPQPVAAPVVTGGDDQQVEVVQLGDGAGSEVRAVFSLPDGINSAADLDVDVSASRIVARSLAGALVADIALPCAVLADSAQAKFSRKRRTMTVTLQPKDQVCAGAGRG